MQENQTGRPLKIFSNLNVIAVIIGIVVGIGIFRLPPIVADSAATGWQYISFWIAGGLISIIGALCYAELATNNPDAGGEYYFLTEAFGSGIGFLFSWGRMTVIQTGSIALAAFILGEYATEIYSLGGHSAAIYAGITVIGLTGLNIIGTQPSKDVQTIMTSLIVGVLLLAGLAGVVNGVSVTPDSSANNMASSSAGAAMIFVLLTYGGWNEGVYLSAEIKDVRKNMVRVLIMGLVTITFLYVLINSAYLQTLGLETLRNSNTVVSALSNKILGPTGSFVMSVFVVIAALSTANATIITGARTNYALGRDFPLLKYIGRWNSEYNAPINALLLQGAIAFALVILGSFTKQSVQSMVDYTAPVFWFFILLTTASLFVFRNRSNPEERAFSVPLYPVTPIIFILVSLYLLYSSVMFTGMGAFFGIGILLLGLPLYYFARKSSN